MMRCDDPVVLRAVDVALREENLEPLLAGLIRVAFGRRDVLEKAKAACAREAEGGSKSHRAAAERLDRALNLRYLWRDE